VAKRMASCEMCIDYCNVNKITIKNNFFWPESIACLIIYMGFITSFECTSSPGAIKFALEDVNVEKISMKAKYDFYKFLIMSFKVCNVSLTFTTLIKFFFMTS
jgi:hypothetical protein